MFIWGARCKMTKYTQEQLLAMTNEQRDEAVALAQGWSRSDALKPAIESPIVLGDLHFWYNGDGEFKEFITNYHPSTNKAPAWDLMVKCLDSGLMKNTLLKLTSYSDELMVAVTIAAILHLQESE